MGVEKISPSDRPPSLGLTRLLLLVGAFLTGLYLSESFGGEEQSEESPALRQPLAQVDR